MTEQATVESDVAEHLPKSRPAHGLGWLRLAGFGRRVLVVSVTAAAVALGAFGVARMSFQTAPSVEDLNSAVNAAIDVLAASPAVEGVQESYILDYLASATWFDWRRDGSAIVIQRVDVDVAESGWWADPANDPLRVGANVTTTIRVLAGETLYEATQIQGHSAGQWTAIDSQEAPHGALALGIAVLTEDGWALEDGEVARTANSDGGTTWTLSAPYLDGTVVQRWEIGAGGELTSWSFEYLSVEDIEKLGDPITAGQMTFVPISHPDPIKAPDADVEPGFTDFGLPHDFPMQDP